MVKRVERLKEREHAVPALLYPDISLRKGATACADNGAGPHHVSEPSTPTPRSASPATQNRRLRIAETFTSLQGEGRLTGVPSFFIRTSGCNLRCWFCDTPYASWNPEGDRLSIESLVNAAVESSISPDAAALPTDGSIDDPDSAHATGPANAPIAVRHVVLTGGEPLVAAGFPELAAALREAGMHVTVETAGTVDVDFPCNLLSLSPKLRASRPDPEAHPKWSRRHEERRMPVATMRSLIERSPAVQVKFVVDSPEEFGEIEEVVTDLRIDAADVWIMPQGVSVEQLDDAAKWLTPWASQQGYQYCDRMQIRWYGNRRGT
ncbi:radical SAM domain-containing protein [Rhodopirellula sallentina SM41]|uniref:7-carboxy-7-deazaguanine synthase n=1 Tax=Rhodopirellula sallentina SM41 TaxID=1263870 RepID=M5UJ27_9BACT|nr:radical SAM domain-containing protein [Rhodopirellula sallentina SM41]